MQEYKIGQKVSDKLVPITVNEYGDKIHIDVNDTTFVNKVINIFKWFDEESAKLDSLSERYDKAAINNVEDINSENVGELQSLIDEATNVYRDICARIDEVFGEGTIRKYFRVMYEAYGEDWVPDDECIEDFVDEIMPVLDQLFEVRKDRLRNKYTKRKKGNGSHDKTKLQLIDEARVKRSAADD